MERLSYVEAREWFWIRTGVWFLPAALGSTMAHFAYCADLIENLTNRLWVATAAGVGSVMIAVLAAYISMQMPWMRLGSKISYVTNGPFCGIIAGFIAFMVCGIILSFMQDKPPDSIEHRALYEAYLALIDRAYHVMAFACAASAFWGFVFGSWFAMRRDKYFIEPIYD